MDSVIREFVNKDATERVIIVRREDGVYSYRKIFDAGPSVAGQPGPHCGLYDSAETAVDEAHARVPWMVETSN